MHAAIHSVTDDVLAMFRFCGNRSRCTNLDVFERVDAIIGFELTVAVQQLEELDIPGRLVFEFGHSLVEDRLHGVETVGIGVVVIVVVFRAVDGECARLPRIHCQGDRAWKKYGFMFYRYVTPGISVAGTTSSSCIHQGGRAPRLAYSKSDSDSANPLGF
jgi:hypothetical protein